MAVPDHIVAWFHKTRGALSPAEQADVGRPARHPDLEAVVEELARFGIPDRFRFVWSADGSGVEEHEPGVIWIHRALTRAAAAPKATRAAAERFLSLDIASVARHEIGHALLFARPEDAHAPSFRRLFGDVDKLYRVGNPVDEVMRRVRRHDGLNNPRYRKMVSLYAATHPHERFAEAVRIAIRIGDDEPALRGWAEERRLSPVVGDQLVWTAHWLRNYARHT